MHSGLNFGTCVHSTSEPKLMQESARFYMLAMFADAITITITASHSLVPKWAHGALRALCESFQNQESP
jgi:hypothetical protein